MNSLIKSPREIEKMRHAGGILARVLSQLASVAEEGMTGRDLDALARDLIVKGGGTPAFLGYQPAGAQRPFPAALCISFNEVVVHGVPTSRRLRSGDLVKLDLGVRYDGYCADAAVTVGVGTIAPQRRKLIEAAERALDAAIAQARSGNTLGDIGAALSREVKRHGFRVVKGLTGHGIGREVHEEPTVLNEGVPGRGLTLAPGMVLAIEPMVSAGSKRIVQRPDESYATEDWSFASHAEHTVLITDGEPEILTTSAP